MKNPLKAVVFGFFPGMGHFYLKKMIRAFIYLFGSIGPVMLGLLLAITTHDDDLLAIAVIGVFVYFISLADIFITALKSKQEVKPVNQNEIDSKHESERFFTIILSFIPGLGHFQLGLMNRGLTLLAAFLGLIVMVFFVAVLSHRGEFLIFLLLLPVIWVYGFFDVIQQLGKKQKGEELIDRTILEDLEMRREDGKRSKAIATFLSIFPGAGHMYLGLQRRGLQLMAAFLFSIYILDVLRLGIFLFLIPIIWFYSFFDGLQRASKYGDEPIEDTPIISYLVNHQRWVGIGLLFLGLYYLASNIIIPSVAPTVYELINIDLVYWFDRYFQTAVVCVLLIGGGLKLLLGSKEKQTEVSE